MIDAILALLFLPVVAMTKLYGFRRGPARTLRRIASTQGLVGRGRPRQQYPGFPSEYGAFVNVAWVDTTAITAATEGGGTRTCGSGTVTLQYANSSNELTDMEDDDGNTVDVTVLNWSLEASGTSTYVLIGMGLDGNLYYINEPC